MPTKPKVFISYSTTDRSIAEALYKDLLDAGAEVFQFERSATPGTSAWDEVLGWIESSDVFIVLVSKSALKSRPVNAEVVHAHYQYLNSNQPFKLIPIVLEEEFRPHRVIRRFAQLPLDDYATGLQRLIAELGLERFSKSANELRDNRDLLVSNFAEGVFRSNRAKAHKDSHLFERFASSP
ncbi:MAG: TIR domain protein [Candidatus Scalindua rubra]|uniref:TIR domain protein n=1 Tax=Candidatus Scalindua rubra TaxID=1872076 RepID=A0A1E3X7Z3_9BACT|nr:MAG: TIR domain protein [Candidatus Scalindua rubra]